MYYTGTLEQSFARGALLLIISKAFKWSPGRLYFISFLVSWLEIFRPYRQNDNEVMKNVSWQKNQNVIAIMETNGTESNSIKSNQIESNLQSV